MKLIPSLDLDLVKSVLYDKRLLKAGGLETDISTFYPSSNFDYLLIEDDARLIGCFQLRKISNTVVESHINLRSEFWGIGDLGYLSCQELFRWIKANTDFQILLTDVPSTCKEVQRLLERLKCRVCGLIKDGVIYKDKKQDLLLYNINLYE